MKTHDRWEEFKGQLHNWLIQGGKDLHNHVVPAFPAFVHGVDQPGTPLNMSNTPQERPSFEETIQKPPVRAAEAGTDAGMEL